MSIEKQVKRALYEARKRGLQADLSVEEWTETLDDYEWKCVYCGAAYWSIDHFIPLAHQGPSSVGNCVPCCQNCNDLKGSTDPELFVYQSALSYKQIALYLEGRKQGHRSSPFAPFKKTTKEGNAMTTVPISPESLHPGLLLLTGEKITVVSNSQEIALQLDQKARDADLQYPPYLKLRVLLTPANCVALATELLNAVASQTNQPHTHEQHWQRENQ